MKRLVILVLAFCSSTWTTGWAAGKPTVYNITVHVTGTHWVTTPSSEDALFAKGFLELDVVINGKKYELAEMLHEGAPVLLTLGDYQAALVKDSHKPNNEYTQMYQLQLPDGSQEDFEVVGASE